MRLKVSKESGYDLDGRHAAIDAFAGPLGFNLRFPARHKDEGSSGPWRRWRRVSRWNALHYNYFRTYDPSTGRYVESDPIGLRGGLNTYAYVGGNPVVRVDPRGLESYVDDSFGSGGGKGEGLALLKACVIRIAAKWQRLRINDKYKHCMVGGEIGRECRGARSGYIAGIIKEIQDIFGPGNAEWADYVATKDGRTVLVDTRDVLVISKLN